MDISKISNQYECILLNENSSSVSLTCNCTKRNYSKIFLKNEVSETQKVPTVFIFENVFQLIESPNLDPYYLIRSPSLDPYYLIRKDILQNAKCFKIIIFK